MKRYTRLQEKGIALELAKTELETTLKRFMLMVKQFKVKDIKDAYTMENVEALIMQAAKLLKR